MNTLSTFYNKTYSYESDIFFNYQFFKCHSLTITKQHSAQRERYKTLYVKNKNTGKSINV